MPGKLRSLQSGNFVEGVMENLEYCICETSSGIPQVSFVNGIFTSKGGKHVEYILNQIIRKLSLSSRTSLEQ